MEKYHQSIKIIDIILLDIHYFNGLEKEDDNLGSKQWKWLEQIMDINKYLNGTSELKGDFILIVSGEQILPIYKSFYHQNIWSQRHIRCRDYLKILYYHG